MLVAKMRPVFYEELDLYGFDKYWEYPKCKEPLLWRVNRTYYTNNEAIGRVVGGGFLREHELEVYKNIKIEPIDIDRILRDNKDAIEKLRNESIDIIKNVANKYKDHTIVVGFSGGKDSLILLDLIYDTLPTGDYIVLFNDTSMELSENYKYIKNITKMYPDIDFRITKHEIPAIEFWKLFGVPSRLHRWCCSVYKMLPTIKFIKSLDNSKILFFDGIRSDESIRRSKLSVITHGKNFRQINAHPILNWTLIYVWLYILERNLEFNPLYRIGIDRLGCIVCPFASEYGDNIIRIRFSDEAKPYLDLVNEYAKKKGVEDIETFISDGNWKIRASGENYFENYIYPIGNTGRKYLIKSSLDRFIQWLRVLGDIEVRDGKIIVDFCGSKSTIEYTECGDLIINILELNRQFISAVKNVANKSAYCVSCGVCEITCPNNAIKLTNGYVYINNCAHCHKCLKVSDRGCLRATSIKIPYKKSKVGDI